MEIATDKMPAVRIANCCGEKFFVDSMPQRYEAKAGRLPLGTRPWKVGWHRLLAQYYHLLLCYAGLDIELITHAFYGGNAVQVKLLADLTDMNIDGAVAHNHIRAPYLV